MANSRKIVIGGALLIALLALSTVTVVRAIKASSVRAERGLASKQQDKKPLELEPAATDVIDKALSSKDPDKRAKRIAKNRRYDKNDSRAKRLTDLPSGGGAVRASEQPPPLPIPVAQSEAIVIATVVKAQPYLTASETSMYTELGVLVEQVIKNDGLPSAAVGSVLDVDREAGAMRLTDGRVIHYETGGIGRVPRNGRRYMLFLRRTNDGADLSIVTGYELRDGRVFPLDGETRVFDPRTGQITRKAPFEGLDESSFLALVQSAVANPNRVLTPDGRLNQ